VTAAEWIAEHTRIRERQAMVATRIADSVCLEPTRDPEPKWVKEYRQLDLLMMALCANAPPRPTLANAPPRPTLANAVGRLPMPLEVVAS
jgi:hypothetical protein